MILGVSHCFADLRSTAVVPPPNHGTDHMSVADTPNARKSRDELICELWVEGTSDREIADRVGCDTQTVRRVRRAAGLTEADRKRRPKRKGMWERRPRSPLHAQFGADVSAHRRLTLDKDLKEYASMVMVSHQRLVEIEAGVHNITLEEIQRICRVMGVQVSDALRLRTVVNV